jgi:hypothetical protein
MDRQDINPGELDALLVPLPVRGDKVPAGEQAGLGNVKNNDPSLVDPV